jgi:hypothetical protein
LVCSEKNNPFPPQSFACAIKNLLSSYLEIDNSVNALKRRTEKVVQLQKDASNHYAFGAFKKITAPLCIWHFFIERWCAILG